MKILFGYNYVILEMNYKEKSLNNNKALHHQLETEQHAIEHYKINEGIKEEISFLETNKKKN